MNKEINEKCKKINCEDILNKKFYPAWFFTNERINNFFPRIKEARKVFAVAGGGDFVFSLLSSPSLKIDEINVCDTKQMACVSLGFKLALFENLNYQEIINLFENKEFFNKNEVYERISGTTTPPIKEILSFVINNCKQNDFLECLKKSGLWYKDSFWQIKNKKEYLFYLTSEEKYQFLKTNSEKISIHCGDFNDNLKLFQDNYYDLIYVSNIFDNKKCCREPSLYLQTIKNKINQNGLLFVTTQNNPKKIIKLLKSSGFSVYQKETHRFNIFSTFLGHYSYSFLLFSKNN